MTAAWIRIGGIVRRAVCVCILIGGAVPSAAVSEPPPTSTGAADTLALQQSSSRIGYIGLTVSGPPGAQVDLYEKVGATEVPITTVSLGQGTVTVARAATWLCQRRARQFVATTRPPTPPQSAMTEVVTPSCAKRLVLRVPRRSRVGRRLTVTVSDRWHLGGMRFRTCLRPPGATARCRSAELLPGRDRWRRSLLLPRPGGWTLTLRTGYGRPGSRLVWAAHPGGRIRLLAAGDSEMQILDDDIAADLRPHGVDVTSDARISTGLTNSFYFDWLAHARGQAPALRPDVTVIIMGANDGFSVRYKGRTVSCCGRSWSAGYASLAASMMRSYLRGDAGRVYWFLLATPRPPKFRVLFDAVNRGLREAAARFPGRVRLIDANALFTPGDRYRDYMSYDGRGFVIHESDGIHLSAASDEVEAKLVLRRMLEDRVIR